MFKFNSFLLVIISFFFASVCVAQNFSNKTYCSPQLQSCFDAILQLPEGKKLLSSIQEKGPIRIVVASTKSQLQFQACWDADQRTIYINTALHTSKGKLIGSILFELHNASINEKFCHYDHLASTRKISKENYIRAIEYLEYENSLNASRISVKGIKSGIFPPSAYLHVYPNFEEHFRMQVIGQHTAAIGRNYDCLAANNYYSMRMLKASYQ